MHYKGIDMFTLLSKEEKAAIKLERKKEDLRKSIMAKTDSIKAIRLEQLEETKELEALEKQV